MLLLIANQVSGLWHALHALADGLVASVPPDLLHALTHNYEESVAHWIT